MDRIEIVHNLRKYVALSDEQISIFFKNAEMVRLKKNQHLILQGDTESPLALIKSGCLMTYHTDADEHDHVIQFGRDMWWTADLQAFENNTPSQYSIKAMAPSVVYLLSKSTFETILTKASCFERYFRMIFQHSLVSHQKRIIRNISFTAEERYKAFKELYPDLEMIVPQKYIASFLGITPEFLSKTRKRLATT
ncbi:MAG: Crp/Fnr family transcriptional regulator [Gracilimonas sp.]